MSINSIILFVAFFDGTVFLVAAIVKATSGFEKDAIMGKEGKEKDKKVEQELQT